MQLVVFPFFCFHKTNLEVPAGPFQVTLFQVIKFPHTKKNTKRGFNKINRKILLTERK